MKAAGALLTPAKGLLMSVDAAVHACCRAKVGAALLAAMAQIADLQPLPAPSLQQAHPMLALQSGVTATPDVAYIDRIPGHSHLTGDCPAGTSPVQPAGSSTIGPLLEGLLRHSLPQGGRDTRRPAAQLQQQPQQVQGAANPTASGVTAKPGAPAAGQAVEGEAHTQQQQQQLQALPKESSMGAKALNPECA